MKEVSDVWRLRTSVNFHSVGWCRTSGVFSRPLAGECGRSSGPGGTSARWDLRWLGLGQVGLQAPDVRSQPVVRWLEFPPVALVLVLRSWWPCRLVLLM